MATLTVKESGGDYASLSAAIAAATSGDIIEISGTWSSAEDSQISTSKNLTIKAVGDSAYPGRPWRSGDTHYRHRNSSAGHSFTLTNTGAISFESLDIQNTSPGTSDEVFRNSTTNTLTLKKCGLGFASRNDQQDIIYVQSAAPTISLESCHLYNAYRAGVDVYAPSGTVTVNINSCTAYDLGYSNTNNDSRSGLVGTYNGTVTVNIFNTLCEINTGRPVTASASASTTLSADRLTTNASGVYNGTATSTETDCAVSATITDSTASAAYILNDVTTSPYDLRLTDHANNTAIDNHSDASGAGLSIPSTDIVGTTISAPYDLGAFEVSSGITGTIAANEADDTSSASGTQTFIGTVNASEAGDTASASGSVSGTVTGTVSATETDDTASASGILETGGSLAATEEGDTASASGTVGDVVSGTASATETGDTASASGTQTFTGTVNASEAGDTASASGTVTAPLTGTVAANEADDTMTATNIEWLSITGRYQVDGQSRVITNQDALITIIEAAGTKAAARAAMQVYFEANGLDARRYPMNAEELRALSRLAG